MQLTAYRGRVKDQKRDDGGQQTPGEESDNTFNRDNGSHSTHIL